MWQKLQDKAKTSYYTQVFCYCHSSKDFTCSTQQTLPPLSFTLFLQATCPLSSHLWQHLTTQNNFLIVDNTLFHYMTDSPLIFLLYLFVDSVAKVLIPCEKSTIAITTVASNGVWRGASKRSSTWLWWMLHNYTFSTFFFHLYLLICYNSTYAIMTLSFLCVLLPLAMCLNSRDISYILCDSSHCNCKLLAREKIKRYIKYLNNQIRRRW